MTKSGNVKRYKNFFKATHDGELMVNESNGDLFCPTLDISVTFFISKIIEGSVCSTTSVIIFALFLCINGR